jgi:prenyltransferase beta subunit
VLAALVVAGSAWADAADRSVTYLTSRQQASGGFAEQGRSADPALTAWTVLALAAAGKRPSGAAAYLAGKPYPTATDLALRVLALDALGSDVSGLANQLAGLRRPDGRIGSALNSTIWGVIALRQAGRPAPSGSVAFLRRHQSANGGWSWAVGVAADSNDTAAAIEALRAAGVAAGARPVRRGISFLAKLHNADGGFELTRNRGSDAQSTAWAIQAYVVAGRKVPKGALAYLARLRRADGSYRYSTRYATTPVWVTSQVVPAVLRRPFPLR